MRKALKPTWHEARAAGRLRRHTDILRDVAHHLSNKPDRIDAPTNAAEAQERFEDFLRNLDDENPNKGLGAATSEFVGDLITRYLRYASHLFECFDDPRIPATTNQLEGFFGTSKRGLRGALGCGSTTNSIVSNLGADALLAFHQMQRPGALDDIKDTTISETDFVTARLQLDDVEKPAIQRRSMGRSLDAHLTRLRRRWLRHAPDS